jgi:hypothetical protein
MEVPLEWSVPKGYKEDNWSKNTHSGKGDVIQRGDEPGSRGIAIVRSR